MLSIHAPKVCGFDITETDSGASKRNCAKTAIEAAAKSSYLLRTVNANQRTRTKCSQLLVRGS